MRLPSGREILSNLSWILVLHSQVQFDGKGLDVSNLSWILMLHSQVQFGGKGLDDEEA